jgi:GAF domain-containing protein
MSISFYTVADKPENELDREKAIADSNLIASPHVARFRPILEAIRRTLNATSAAITIVYQDSSYVLSAVGFESGIYKRSTSFCAHAILSPHELTVIHDAGADERFAGNPFVDAIHGIQFYLGAPLLDENGTVLGALCAFDEKPRYIITDKDKARIIELKKEAEAVAHDIAKLGKTSSQHAGVLATQSPGS